jgi:hypothetical protein
MASKLEKHSPLADRLRSIATLIASCDSLAALQYRHAAIVHRLGKCRELARLARARAGSPSALEGLDRLSQTVRDHPAFEGRQTAEGQAMQAELQSLVARIGRGA